MPAQKVWTNKDTEKYLPPVEDDFQPDDFTPDIIDEVQDDFVADEIKTQLEQVVNQPKNQSFARSVLDFATTPLSNAPSQFIDKRADEFDKPSLNRSPMRARLEGFSAGAAQGVGDLLDEATSPLSLATMAFPFAGRIARGTINTLGKATEGVGSFMRKYQPLTGMPIISPLAGRNLQRAERMVGRGLENVGKKIRVKTVDGKITEAPVDSILKQGDEIPEEVILKEGQELTKSAKPKVRRNQDGTYTNLDTGEVFGSDGKPMAIPLDKNSPFFKKNQF